MHPLPSPSFSQGFPSGKVEYHMAGTPEGLVELAPPANALLLTDENVWAAHGHLFRHYKTVVLPAGEAQKSMATVEQLAREALAAGLDRGGTLIGLGGGVVTDIAGFLAAVYLRGVRLGLCPTTILAAADAAVGGKNGVNTGAHKNILGTIRQPAFYLLMPSLLHTLPAEEWSNGFAEVLKYGAIADAELWKRLAARNISFYQQNTEACTALLSRCIHLKNGIVAQDEGEQGIRKLLNFGHTAGHALERLCHLPHGAAIAIGMHFATRLSVAEAGLDARFSAQLCAVLEKYGLPARHPFNADQAVQMLQSDKKRQGNTIDFVLLKAPGQAFVKPLPVAFIAAQLKLFVHEG